MRYFLLGFVLISILVVSIAGFRGGTSRKPPWEIFPDMDRQLKLRPQTTDGFFPDGRSSRQPVAGTIERSAGYQLASGDTNVVYAFEDSPVNTGRVTGATNFVETIPFEVTKKFIARGQQRYQIYCAPCHSPVGDGNGVTKKLGMATVANLHDPRIVKLPDGELFFVITNGRNTMYPYGGQIPVEDRWAIVAYLRALQLSQLAWIDDVPDAEKTFFRK
ncbi:MAG: cytochrome c [Verrucomicrobiota bacterium]